MPGRFAETLDSGPLTGPLDFFFAGKNPDLGAGRCRAGGAAGVEASTQGIPTLARASMPGRSMILPIPTCPLGAVPARHVKSARLARTQRAPLVQRPPLSQWPPRHFHSGLHTTFTVASTPLSQWPPRLLQAAPAWRCACSAHTSACSAHLLTSACSALCLLGTSTYKCLLGTVPARHIYLQVEPHDTQTCKTVQAVPHVMQKPCKNHAKCGAYGVPTRRTLTVPRILAICAICAIWVSQGKPLNLHSPPGPCYMCYMCYMALTRQATEPPLSSGSLLYVLYVLYVLYGSYKASH